MRAVDTYLASNISATTAAFSLQGGRYAACVMGSNFGTVKLQMLAADGSTMVDLKAPFDKPDGTGGTEEDLVIGTFAANGTKVFDLPPGQYKLTVSSATAVYASITRIPSD
jgi:hypothetical protein